MDNRAIGVFDSGLGGLTAVREIKRAMPGENIVYFGDTGRVPYGSRSEETIIKYSREDIEFLLGFDIKAILAACGTASSVALPKIAGEYSVDITGVIEPSAKAAARLTRNGKIGVVGTAGTIRSGAYRKAIAGIGDYEVIDGACPLLVPLVENGRFSGNDRVVRILVEEYFSPILEGGADTIILGCTHYPLLVEVIGEVCGDGITLVDSGASAATALRERLGERNMLGDSLKGTAKYYVSDRVADFTEIAEYFLGAPVESEIELVSVGC